MTALASHRSQHRHGGTEEDGKGSDGAVDGDHSLPSPVGRGRAGGSGGSSSAGGSGASGSSAGDEGDCGDQIRKRRRVLRPLLESAGGENGGAGLCEALYGADSGDSLGMGTLECVGRTMLDATEDQEEGSDGDGGDGGGGGVVDVDMPLADSKEDNGAAVVELGPAVLHAFMARSIDGSVPTYPNIM